MTDRKAKQMPSTNCAPESSLINWFQSDLSLNMLSLHVLGTFKNREKQLSVKVTQTRQQSGLLPDKYPFISAGLFTAPKWTNLPLVTPAPEESTWPEPGFVPLFDTSALKSTGRKKIKIGFTDSPASLFHAHAK